MEQKLALFFKHNKCKVQTNIRKQQIPNYQSYIFLLYERVDLSTSEHLHQLKTMEIHLTVIVPK